MVYNLPHTMPTEKFISLIRDRPAIWNRNCDEYSNKAARNKSWAEILTEIYPDFQTWKYKDKRERVRQVIAKWTRLRDAYLKAEKTRAKLQDKRTKPYIYKEIRFLRSIYFNEPAELEDNLSDDTVIESDKYAIDPKDKIDYLQVEEENYRIDSDQGGDDIDESEDVYVTEVNERPKRQKLDDRRLSSVNVTMTHPEPAPSYNSESHEFFFKGIIPMLETLNEDEIIEFQIGVLKLIKEIKRQRE